MRNNISFLAIMGDKVHGIALFFYEETMDKIFTLLTWLLSSSSGTKTLDYAGQFAQPGDKWAGGASVCLWREVRPDDHIIAHRTLPCGTQVLIYNPRTQLSTVATVGDHGPYGACLDEGWVKGTPCRNWVVKKKATDPGTWRGSFDLTPSVGNAIGQRGIELIEVTVLRNNHSKSNFLSKATRPSS